MVTEIKEPWQMTKQERNLLGNTKKQIVEMDNSVKFGWAKELGYSGSARTVRDMGIIEQYILQQREDVVRRALSEGKPIPAEVLKDYPELQAKVQAAATGQEVLAEVHRHAIEAEKETTENKEIANTIVQQMGGRALNVMAGAKRFTITDKGLKFSLPSGFAKNGINQVQVDLTPEDTYKVKFNKIGRAPNFTATEVSTHDNIYAEDLTSLFEKETGLTLSMPKIHRAEPEVKSVEKAAEWVASEKRGGYPSNDVIGLLKYPNQPNKNILLDNVNKYLATNKAAYEEYKTKVKDVPELQSIIDEYELAAKAISHATKEKAPVAKVEKPAITREPKSYVLSLDDSRSDHAIRIDQAIEAKEVVDRRSKKGVARWKTRRNQMDVRGVDTPKRQHKPPTRAVLDRRGHYHKQRSGTVI